MRNQSNHSFRRGITTGMAMVFVGAMGSVGLAQFDDLGDGQSVGPQGFLCPAGCKQNITVIYCSQGRTGCCAGFGDPSDPDDYEIDCACRYVEDCVQGPPPLE